MSTPTLIIEQSQKTRKFYFRFRHNFPFVHNASQEKIDKMDKFDTFLGKLKCTICKNFMQIPKSLPCGHDMCENCMQSYIFRTVPMTGYDLLDYVKDNKLQVKPTQKYFECPVEGCGVKYGPTRPNKNTRCWALDLDNSVQKIHMMEVFNGKRRKDTKFCNVCILSPSPQSATVVCTSCCSLFCNKCTFIHKQINPSHEIVDLVIFENGSTLVYSSKSESAVAKSIQREETTTEASDMCLTEKSTVMSVNRKGHSEKDVAGCSGSIRFTMCPIHRPCEEVLYCKDCDIYCCIKCSDANHVTCKNVYSIQKLFKKMTDNRAAENLKAKSETLLEKCSTSVGLYKGLEAKMKGIAQMQPKTLTDNIIEGIERVSGLLRRYDYFYNQAKRCVTPISIVDRLEANEFIKMVFSIEKECLKLEEEYVKAVLRDSDVNMRMVEMVENKPKGDKNKHEASVVDKVPQNTFMCHSNRDSLKNASYTQVETKTGCNDATDELKFETKILAKSASDKNDCWLIKCILLQSMDIIVADQTNKKIKLISEMQKVHEVKLESVPLSIAVCEPDLECFVSLPNEQKVIVINISKNDFVVCSEIQTEQEVFDIGILNSGTLLCVGNGPESFHQLYRNGISEKVQHHGQFDDKHREVFQKASHLKVVEHKDVIVFVSDIQNNIIASYRINRDLDNDVGNKYQRTKEAEIDHKTDSKHQPRYSSLDERNQIEYRDNYSNSTISKSHEIHKYIDMKPSQTVALNGIENSIVVKDAIAPTGTSFEDSFLFSNDSQHEHILTDVDSSGKIDTKSVSSSVEECVELDIQNLQTEPRVDYVAGACLDLGVKNLTSVSLKPEKRIEISNPSGFDLDSIGNIYVCCNSQCEVLRIGTDRKEKFKILDMPSPRGLSIHQDRMILTVDSGPRQNYVMVYQLKKQPKE